MSTLSTTIIQADLHWHDAKANRRSFDDVFDSMESRTDLVVLPEMFTTGFSMDAPHLAETMDGESIQWMQDKARQTEATVCGSLIVSDDEHYFNRFLVVDASGVLLTYDKRHLFRLADEQHYYQPGSELTTFEINGFRIRPMICYDLRFPVWSRNRDDYDLLIYVANWPSRRHHAWETLLRARAIENLSYVVGVNRVGTDGNDLPYVGGSAVIDYLGQEVADLGDRVGTTTSTLDLEQLEKFRDRFAFHKDADAFQISG
jgi:predicted amidohydrolase